LPLIHARHRGGAIIAATPGVLMRRVISASGFGFKPSRFAKAELVVLPLSQDPHVPEEHPARSEPKTAETWMIYYDVPKPTNDTA